MGFQPREKLRFRSTPLAFCRVPALDPSGFRSGTSNNLTSSGIAILLSLRTTDLPAHSFPWMHPITSTEWRAPGSPLSKTPIARSSTDRPIRDHPARAVPDTARTNTSASVPARVT
jgi:hypothetical protein